MTESYIEIYHKDNLEVLKNMKSNSIDLVYIDPPFNTGKIQDRKSLKTIRSNNGDRTGCKGQKYSTKIIGSKVLIKSFFLLFTESISKKSLGQDENIIRFEDWSFKNESTEKLYFSKISIISSASLI